MARAATNQQKRTLEQRPLETIDALRGDDEGGYEDPST